MHIHHCQAVFVTCSHFCCNDAKHAGEAADQSSAVAIGCQAEAPLLDIVGKAAKRLSEIRCELPRRGSSGGDEIDFGVARLTKKEGEGSHGAAVSEELSDAQGRRQKRLGEKKPAVVPQKTGRAEECQVSLAIERGQQVLDIGGDKGQPVRSDAVVDGCSRTGNEHSAVGRGGLPILHIARLIHGLSILLARGAL